jgi:hypothetical protein
MPPRHRGRAQHSSSALPLYATRGLCSVRPLRRTFRSATFAIPEGRRSHNPTPRLPFLNPDGCSTTPRHAFPSSIPEGLIHPSPALQAAAQQTHATWGQAANKQKDIPEGLRKPASGNRRANLQVSGRALQIIGDLTRSRGVCGETLGNARRRGRALQILRAFHAEPRGARRDVEE